MTTAADTRQRILDIALDCFLEYGYEGTTVARIREASAVSNGALFHHFRSKEAIAAAIFVDAIRDFQDGHWEILASPPATLREGVRAIVAHHLEWVQANPDRARFLYDAGRPVSADASMEELRDRNGELAAAYASWYGPLVERGEARKVRPGLVVAIVGGPAHAICRHWLSGTRERPLTRHTDELAHAAWAGLAGPAALGGADSAPPAAPTAPAPARVRVELLADDGTTLGVAESTIRGSGDQA